MKNIYLIIFLITLLAILFVIVKMYESNNSSNTELELPILLDDSVKKYIDLSEDQWKNINEINSHYIEEKTKLNTSIQDENKRMKEVIKLRKGSDSLIIKSSKRINKNELNLIQIQQNCFRKIERILSEKQKEIIRCHPIDFANYYQNKINKLN
ncbi:MAG: hypothetical protein WCI53_13995 [Bacteroidota bacterium]